MSRAGARPGDRSGARPGDRPRVSVVVPFFDDERSLAPCVESLLAQEAVGEPYEVVLVDNGSTDASASVAARFDEAILLAESTPGAYAARNTGIRRAEAPIVAFTDADCVAAPDWLAAIRGGMEDPAVAVLLGNCRYPDDASLALRVLAAYENAKAEYVIDHCPPEFRFAWGNNMAVRASAFDELGLFEEWPRAADSELVHRLAARRPNLRVAYRRSMRVIHTDFVRARDRARRLALYRKTNSRIDTFRELGRSERLGVLGYLLRRLGRRVMRG